MGTLRYKVVKRRNPMTAAVSYGPRLLRYTLIKADDVVERAAQNSNIDRGLLEAAMVGFQEAVRNFIMNGHNLHGYKARQNIRLVRIGEEEAEGGGEEEEGA